MTIPTYWEREEGWKEGDTIYDHPTPLDREGTLCDTLKSIDILEDKNFELVIIASATGKDSEEKVEKKVLNIIEKSEVSVKTHLISHSHISRLKKYLCNDGKEDFTRLISIKGYPNIRNISLISGQIFNADAVILIDDDELFEDSLFINKVKENLSNNIKIFAGYYLNRDNDYILKKEEKEWEKEWKKLESMNEGFKKIIGSPPKIKKTPFGFGGNMIIHRDIFQKIPFDPEITRGEDIDYIINCRLSSIDFFLDNSLSVKHVPPPHSGSAWKQLGEDVVRFVYEREKLKEGRIAPEEFLPYPGEFLKDNLMEKIEKACRLLAGEYEKKGDIKGQKKSLDIIKLAKNLEYKNAYKNFCTFQKEWEEMMSYLKESTLRSVMSDGKT